MNGLKMLYEHYLNFMKNKPLVIKKLPAKLAPQEYCSISGNKILFSDEKTGKDRVFIMPKWLVKEIKIKLRSWNS